MIKKNKIIIETTAKRKESSIYFKIQFSKNINLPNYNIKQ